MKSRSLEPTERTQGNSLTSSRTVLMNPGPVVVDERVRRALMKPDICHRETEFSELLTSIREKLTRICGGDDAYTTVLLSGSGTAALESTLSSIVPPGEKILILDNGHYGERLFKIVALHGILHEHIRFGWASQIEIEALERALANDQSIRYVGMVHHETSTGMLNPVRATGEIVARHGRSLLVDAISSLGGEVLDVSKDNIDWCIGTANKCLEGFPGASFVCAKRASLESLVTVRPRTFYLDLYGLYISEDRDQSPMFTPAIQIFYALDQALDLLLEEGLAQRTARYAALSRQLREGLTRLGFRLLIPMEHQSNTLTAVYLPDGVSYNELHAPLKKAGFVIYAGQDLLKHKVFRLANMGQITAEEINRFLQSLKCIVDEMGDKAR